MTPPPAVHAGLIARRTAGGWRGVLLRGASGRGKSDLGLRLAGRGWRLVADDRVILWRSGDRLWGRAPDVLQGLLEVRGVGVLPTGFREFSQVILIVDCTREGQPRDRLPEPSTETLEGVAVPRLHLNALEASAPDKIAAFCESQRL